MFRALAGDAAQAGENIGNSMSRWMEDTASIEDENVARTLAADAENARAISAIRPHPGNLTESGAGAGDFGKPSFISRILGGDKPDTNKQIDQALDKVNPKFKRGEYPYSQNCTSCVQANELLRRGLDVEAKPIDTPKGRDLSSIEDTWGGQFQPGSKTDIERAFSEPGSRGVVSILWHNGDGGHVFNVENVDGKVRFVDGQPNPPLTDASQYFNYGHSTNFIRLDDKPTPPGPSTDPYVINRTTESPR